MRRDALVTMLAASASAQVTDRPVSGKRLFAERSASGGRLVFVSKDPALVFPQNGSFDDFSDPAGCAPIFCYDQDARCGGGAPPLR